METTCKETLVLLEVEEQEKESSVVVVVTQLMYFVKWKLVRFVHPETKKKKKRSEE